MRRGLVPPKKTYHDPSSISQSSSSRQTLVRIGTFRTLNRTFPHSGMEHRTPQHTYLDILNLGWLWNGRCSGADTTADFRSGTCVIFFARLGGRGREARYLPPCLATDRFCKLLSPWNRSGASSDRELSSSHLFQHPIKADRSPARGERAAHREITRHRRAGRQEGRQWRVGE